MTQSVTERARAFAAAADALFVAMRRSRATIGIPGELTAAQASLVEPLADGAPKSIGRIAAEVGVSAPTVTRGLNQLEAAGVVRRLRSDLDERVVLVSLTDHGHALRSRMADLLMARQVATLRRFTAEEQRTLTAQLANLARYIDAASD